MKKLIIAGTRTFSNYKLLEKEVYTFIKDYLVSTIFDGCAQGADRLGRQYAKEDDLEIKKFPALWNSYGSAAGPIRNKLMASEADMCIIFWDGKSRGTQSMINEAKKANLVLKVIVYPTPKI